MKQLLPILVFCLFLVSCRTEIEYKGPEAEPSLYVYGLFDNDTLNYLFVGETSFFLDNENTDCLSNALVTLQVNDEDPVTLGYDSKEEKYVCTEHFKSGDTLWLSVSHARLGSAEAVAIVPPKVNMALLDCEFARKGIMYSNYAVILFHAQDCKAMSDYYFSFTPYTEVRVVTDYDFDGETEVLDTFLSGNYYSVGEFISADNKDVGSDVDIWSLICSGDDIKYSLFDMKKNDVQSRVEFDYQWHYEFDSLTAKGFFAELVVYSPEYVQFKQQSRKARSESSNPFVEPTQVMGNIIPTGNTKYAFGCFSVSRKSRTIRN